MLVNLEDGQCRSCQHQLEIVDFDDISLHVACTNCGESYEVETDAFGDGCVTYYLVLVAQRMGIGEGAT
ncbi:MAG: hypothetical protein U0796_12905 [Gemmatales bacterium]